MKVGELKKILAELPSGSDDLVITIRAADDDTDEFVCCGVASVSVDYAHDGDDTPYLAIDGNTSVEES